jgi:pyruvate/2-oxoglutarate dehydrogenase complex dihydrolipoamide acyltransferase (E2) component
MPDMSLGGDDDNHGPMGANHNMVEEWFKRPGDIIRKNDVLCDITTPDFTFGMVTDDDEMAIMGDIHVPAGVHVPDHTPICTVYHYGTPEDKEAGKTNKKDDDDEED